MGGELNYLGYSKSVRGKSHDISGLPCQDYSGHLTRKGYSISVVSDGHGSTRHFRSDIGSKLAVEGTICILDGCMSDGCFLEALFNDPNAILHRICNAIIAGWTSSVQEYDSQNPLTSEEQSYVDEHLIDVSDVLKRYGTTLVAGIISKDVIFGIQIGDGELILINDSNEALSPIPEDDDCFLNHTSSLCGNDASDKMRSFSLFNGRFSSISPNFIHIDANPNIVKSLIVCTDGLATSFTSKESFYHYCTVASEVVLCRGGISELESNLLLRSKSNMEDDVSISMSLSKYHFKDIIEKERILSINEGIKRKNKKLKRRKRKHTLRRTFRRR